MSGPTLRSSRRALLYASLAVAVFAACGEPTEPQPEPPDPPESTPDTTRPVAVLDAPTSVGFGADFTLDGRRSKDTAPGTVKTYRWRALTASGGGLFIDDDHETSSATYAVTASTDPVPLGAQRYQLIVVDAAGNLSSPAEVTIAIVDVDAPTATLEAPTAVEQGESFTLDGSGSFDEPPGAVTSYTWTAGSPEAGFAGGALSLSTMTPTLTVGAAPDVVLPGSYTYELVAVDAAGNESPPATATVVVRDTKAPTAVVSAPGTVDEGVDFVLDGSGSSDPEPGTVAAYLWTSIDASGGGLTQLIAHQTASPTLTLTASDDPLPAGTLRFELIVLDAVGNASFPAVATVEVAEIVNVEVSVAPAGDTLTAGAARRFTATVTGTNEVGVTWYVDGVEGGSTTLGFVDDDGRYEAPSDLPSDLTVTLKAESLIDPSASASATVVVRALPQRWARSYSLPSFDRGSPVDLARLADGTLFVLGTMNANANEPTSLGEDDTFLAKLDPLGRLLWVRVIGTPTRDTAGSLVTNPDDTLTVFGVTRAFPGTGDDALFAARLDADGNLLAQRFARPGWGFSAPRATRRPEGGYLLAAGRNGFMELDEDLHVTYAAGSNGDIVTALPLPGGDTVLSSRAVGESYARVARFDGTWTLKWSRNLWRLTDMHAVRAANGEVVVAASNSGGSALYLSAFDDDGNLTWSRNYAGADTTFADTYNDHLNLLEAHGDGFALSLSAGGNPYVPHLSGLFLLRTNATGDPTALHRLNWYGANVTRLLSRAGDLFWVAADGEFGMGFGVTRAGDDLVGSCARFTAITDPVAKPGLAWLETDPLTIGEKAPFEEAEGTLVIVPIRASHRLVCPTDGALPCGSIQPGSLAADGEQRFTVGLSGAGYLETTLRNDLGAPRLSLLDPDDDAVTWIADPPLDVPAGPARELHWYFESELTQGRSYPLQLAAGDGGGDYTIDVTGWGACPTLTPVP